jgi:hypothetical protein
MQGDMLTASLVTCKAKSFCTLLKNYRPYCLNRSSKCAAVVRHPTKDGWPQVWYRAHRLRINDRGMCSADRRIRSNDTGLFSRRKKSFIRFDRVGILLQNWATFTTATLQASKNQEYFYLRVLFCFAKFTIMEDS